TANSLLTTSLLRYPQYAGGAKVVAAQCVQAPVGDQRDERSMCAAAVLEQLLLQGRQSSQIALDSTPVEHQVAFAGRFDINQPPASWRRRIGFPRREQLD